VVRGKKDGERGLFLTRKEKKTPTKKRTVRGVLFHEKGEGEKILGGENRRRRQKAEQLCHRGKRNWANAQRKGQKPTKWGERLTGGEAFQGGRKKKGPLLERVFLYCGGERKTF